MSLDFVAVDFETASPKRDSICSVGLARVEGGRVVEQTEWFIEPPEMRWTNTRIHGITAADVIGAPRWPASYDRLAAFVGDLDLIGYSGFDASAFAAANARHDIDGSHIGWHNALTIARRRFPADVHGLPNHKLPTMVSHFALGAFSHHSAGDDAAMCARVTIAMAQATGCSTIDELSERPVTRRSSRRW